MFLSRWTSCSLGRSFVGVRPLRTFCTAVSSMSRSETQQTATSKSRDALLKLRKETGFGFKHCREALQKFENDLAAAHEWLIARAEEEGWAKVSGLQHRPMSSGLVGVCVSDGFGAIVEVNCETDFVTKTSEFQQLVADTCIAVSKESISADGFGAKLELSSDEMLQLSTPSLPNSRLADVKADVVRAVGENVQLRRAVTLSAPHIGFYVHSSGLKRAIPSSSAVQLGRFGSLVSFRCDNGDDDGHRDELASVGRKLAQHVVGMSPTEIGQPSDYVPRTAEDRDLDNDQIEATYSEDEPEGDDAATAEAPPVENRLLFQNLVGRADDGTVFEFVDQHCCSLLDFVRFEVGETVRPHSDDNGVDN